MAIQLKPCQVCDKEFYGTIRAMYCSNNCKQKAFQRKIKDAKNEQALTSKAV